ncbi:unnamed protein product [Lactuca saligna]|uniref:DNA-dependent metalloprotease WSS1 n=1 Tax=Lactuca saligna TaxID=75948 RepID=A0AA36EGC0_LACSI|nr:unnamed protein product [Lactuca saligna]
MKYEGLKSLEVNDIERNLIIGLIHDQFLQFKEVADFSFPVLSFVDHKKPSAGCLSPVDAFHRSSLRPSCNRVIDCVFETSTLCTVLELDRIRLNRLLDCVFETSTSCTVLDFDRPKNPRLLGLNVGHGLHVKLRLRKPNTDWDFYPFDHVLDTMLHELCHNTIGPHNAGFYKLWDELRKECEELMSKGILGSGDGFDLPGRRLGGFSHQPPLSSLRPAAENRARQGPSGPKRVGEEVIEEEESSAQVQQNVTSFSSAKTHQRGGPPSESCFVDLTSPAKRGRDNDIHRSSSGWECMICTLLNPVLAPVCELCGTHRPKSVEDKYKTWSCKFCTLENNVTLEKCGACGQWRYSYGQPIATPSPNVGT